MRMKLAAGIIAVIIIAAIAVYLQKYEDISEKEVKIGAILWLTGDYSVVGTSMQRGIEIAAEELNERGDIRYDIVFEDEGGINPRAAVEASRKLADIDNVDAILIPGASEAKSVLPISQSSKVPFISLIDSNDEIKKGDYIFGVGFSTEGASNTMAEFAYGNLGARNVSIVHTFDDWSQLIANGFRKDFEAFGGNIVLFEGTGIDENDFRTVITKSEGTDAIYAPLLLPSHMIRQAKELGYEGYVLSADALTQDQIDASGNAAEGVYQTNVYLPENEKFQKLIEKYREKYEKEPDAPEFAAISYDAMYAIDAAVRENGIGREQIKNGLYGIRFEGATGIVDFDEAGVSPRFERIFIIRNNTAVLIG